MAQEPAMLTVKEAMSELGRIGGSVRSARKSAACRQNLKRAAVAKADKHKLSNERIDELASKFVAEFRAAQG